MEPSYFKAWDAFHMAAYFPPAPASSSWVPLPAGKLVPVLPDHRVIPMLHIPDKAVAVGLAAGPFHLPVRCIRPCVADIIADGIVKQKDILVHQADTGQYLLRRLAQNIPAADGNAAALGRIVPGYQVQDGGFSGTGIPPRWRLGSFPEW